MMSDFIDVITMESVPNVQKGANPLPVIDKAGFVQLFTNRVLRGAARHFWQHQLAYDRVVLNDYPFDISRVIPIDAEMVFNCPMKATSSLGSYSVNASKSHVGFMFALEETTGHLVKNISGALKKYGGRYSERVLIPLKLKEPDRFMIARLCDLKKITDDTLEVCYDTDMWRLQLAFGCGAGVSSAKCSAVKSAIEIVNDSFSNPGLLTSVFGRNTFGMSIPVVIDNSDDYHTRNDKAKNGREDRRWNRDHDRDPYALDNNCRDPRESEEPSNDSFDPTPYDVIDVLGTYSPPTGFITLYVKAIEEFMVELGLAGQDMLTHLCAYVLAHEVFHAYQDFHVDLKSCNHVNGEDPEVSAEYYGLRFVKDILKDDVLFDALCDHRANNRLTGYSDALSKYGDIKDEVSVGDFIKTVASWN